MAFRLTRADLLAAGATEGCVGLAEFDQRHPEGFVDYAEWTPLHSEILAGRSLAYLHLLERTGKLPVHPIDHFIRWNVSKDGSLAPVPIRFPLDQHPEKPEVGKRLLRQRAAVRRAAG